MRFDTRVYFTTEMILILVEIFLGISSLSCHHLQFHWPDRYSYVLLILLSCVAGHNLLSVFMTS